MKLGKPFALIACIGLGGCGSDVDGTGGSPLVGTWAATIEEPGATSKLSWRFYADGHFDSILTYSRAGVTSWVCGGKTSENGWEDRGGKVALRTGGQTVEHAFEVVDGGRALRLDPPRKLGNANVNTYARTDSEKYRCASGKAEEEPPP